MSYDDPLYRLEKEKEFVENWLSDLLDTIGAELGEEMKARLIAGCGRGCFNRFEFKQQLAEQGQGDVDKLVAALSQNFEVWREGDLVHIRYGEVSQGCYCPVLRNRPFKPDDPHCNCTRATHQAIWERALGRPFEIDILETVRRGGKTCHFLVHLS